MKSKLALTLIENLVEKRRGKNFGSVEREIVLGAWEGLSYKQIAIRLELNQGYLASQAGPKVWKLISESLLDLGINEEVSKKNLKGLIERNASNIKSRLGDSSKNLIFSESNTKQKILSNLEIKEFELPEGTLSIGSNLYIERLGIEKECYSQIKQPGGFIRIKAPNQMGKTSLIIRIIELAKENEIKAAYFNFKDDADNSYFSDFQEVLKWFCVTISESLGMEDKTEKYWAGRGPQKIKFRRYFENYLLENINKPILLAIDDIDCIFGEPVENDFLSLLRAIHELSKKGNNTQLWKRVRVVLSHSTEVYSKLNINNSPFNVGLPIEIKDFGKEEILQLLQCYGLKYNDEIQKLILKIGGHPHLIQMAFYNLAMKKMTVSELLKKAHTEEGIYGFHLRRHLSNLENKPDLRLAIKLLMENNVTNQLGNLERFKLYSMGLVNLDGNQVKIRSEIYQKYFQEVLV